VSDHSLSTAFRHGLPEHCRRSAWLAALVVASLLPGCQRAPTAEKAEPAPAPKAAPKRVDAVDPPPPPPPEPEAPSPAPAAPAPSSATAAPKAAAGTAAQNKRSSPCDASCGGSATAELQSALRAKAGQARSCYERALSHNSELQGSLTVQVRIGPGGEVCAATLGKDKLGDPAVTGCVVQRFRGGPFPKPSGGCVDVEVPINFVPRQAG
jgi:hypothetical protein